jgi:hypothetical protein
MVDKDEKAEEEVSQRVRLNRAGQVTEGTAVLWVMLSKSILKVVYYCIRWFSMVIEMF